MTAKKEIKDFGDLLQSYTDWLLEHGYTDDDVWCEPPTAIDRFVKEMGIDPNARPTLSGEVTEIISKERLEEICKKYTWTNNPNECAYVIHKELSSLLKPQEQRQGLSEESELNRLYGWLFMDNRPKAQTFFTEGALRNVAKEIEFRLSAPTSEEREKYSELMKLYCAMPSQAYVKQLEAELGNCKRDLKASESVGNQLADHIEHLNKELAELKATPRTVTDEEMLGVFKNHRRMNFEWEWIEKHGAMNYEAFVSAVRDLLKGGEQWISVEERLPEREQSVLVYSPQNEELFQIFDAVFDGEMFRELDANDYAETLYTEGSYVGVTHWMPMPEPPKTKGGEGK